MWGCSTVRGRFMPLMKMLVYSLTRLYSVGKLRFFFFRAVKYVSEKNMIIFFLAVSMSRCPDMKFVKYLRQARSSEKSGGRREKQFLLFWSVLKKTGLLPPPSLPLGIKCCFFSPPLPWPSCLIIIILLCNLCIIRGKNHL